MAIDGVLRKRRAALQLYAGEVRLRRSLRAGGEGAELGRRALHRFRQRPRRQACHEWRVLQAQSKAGELAQWWLQETIIGVLMLIDQRLNHELTLAGSYFKKKGYLTKKKKLRMDHG